VLVKRLLIVLAKIVIVKERMVTVWLTVIVQVVNVERKQRPSVNVQNVVVKNQMDFVKLIVLVFIVIVPT